jgi:hypothetical protein
MAHPSLQSGAVSGTADGTLTPGAQETLKASASLPNICRWAPGTVPAVPIDPERLQVVLARAVSGLPAATADSIHALLVEELAAAEEVVPATARPESQTLVAIGITTEGDLSLCRFDAGPTVHVTSWGKLHGVTLDTELEVGAGGPASVRRWILRHPRFPHHGTLTIDGAAMMQDEQVRIAAALKRLVDH